MAFPAGQFHGSSGWSIRHGSPCWSIRHGATCRDQGGGSCREVNRGGLPLLYEILLESAGTQLHTVLQIVTRAAERQQPTLFFCKLGGFPQLFLLQAWRIPTAGWASPGSC